MKWRVLSFIVAASVLLGVPHIARAQVASTGSASRAASLLLKQSTARTRLVFMASSVTHTAATGLTLTITASKNGGAFASITPNVTDLGNGWYALALTSSHTDTLGDLSLHVTASAADTLDFTDQVVTDIAFASLPISLTTGVSGLLPPANGGLGIGSGTSGGIPAYTASGTIASSGELTVNLPVIGGGAGAAPTVGSRSGNTTKYVTTTGALTADDCVKIDASGNFVANGAACGSGGGGGTPGGSTTQVQYNNAGSFGGITGATTNGTALTLVAPVLGTPASATLTNATGLPISTGVSGLGSNVATALATPSSANVAAAVTDETGSGALVFATSPTFVTPVLGTPTSATLTNATGLPISTGVSGLGANVATALATPSSVNLASAVVDETGSGALVFSNSPTLVTPALGTPASGTMTNVTGLPVSTGISGLGTNVATFLATPSSANLAAAVTGETGTGGAVFDTSPTLSSPLMSGIRFGYITKAATYNPVLSTDYMIDCLTAAFTVTLPAPTTSGETHVIKNAQTSNTCTLATASGTIDGSATIPVLNGAVTVVADGVSQWRISSAMGADCGSFTSGGIPYFSSTAACASSGLLSTNRLVLGGGAGAAPSTLGSNGSATTLLHGAAGTGAPSFSAVSLTADVSGTLPVANGGTGLTAGTSGGVLAYTASGTLASSGALTANMPVIGGGAGVAPTVGTVSGNTTKFATMTGSIASGNCVKVDASGNLQDYGGACNAGVGGASAALDNLASVSINTALLPQTGVDLGSTTKPFRDLYLFGSGTYSTTYVKFATAPTGTRTVTIPDATDTLVGKATTDVLTNKSLSDTTDKWVNASDNTKVAKWDLSGATTGTTTTVVSSQTANRTITYPNATGTLPIILKSSGTAASDITGTTAETNEVVVTIPQNMMGTNGHIQIMMMWKFTNTNGAKTPTIRLSTTSGDVSGGFQLTTSASLSTSLSLYEIRDFWNANAANSQITFALNIFGPNISNQAGATGSIDTSAADTYLNINGTLANGSDHMQLMGYTVVFYPGT